MVESDNTNRIIACHGCGQVAQLPDMEYKTTAICSRCGSKLFRKLPDSVDKTLALAFTALILFIVSNIYPFLAMRIGGFIQGSNLITGIENLYHQGMPGLALLVLLTVVILPLFQIAGLIYIFLPFKLGFVSWKTAEVFRAMRYLQAWTMMEIYLLGILISMIKLAKMAAIIPGLASFAFFFLICVLTAALSGLNPEDIWKRIPVKKENSKEDINQIENKMTDNKKETTLAGCHSCLLLCRLPVGDHHYICPRCNAPLHFRKIDSLNRTWALLIAAAIIYFPANILPITLTGALGHVSADTILSGVIYFLFSGSWHIAIIIFVASIIVPLTKMIIFFYLLISIKRKSMKKPEDRTRLYHITEAVGRWSMVDVYVVTIMVALVKLGFLADIEAGPGAVFFAGVVVITMLAAESFDPRLIWDAMEESNEHK